MSLVIAEIRDGVTYIGADTQTSSKTVKEHHFTEPSMKVIRMPRGILLCAVGAVNSSKRLFARKDWFDELGEAPLSKQFLVTKIVSRFYCDLKEQNLLEQKSGAQCGSRFIVAQENRLFSINRDFSVSVIPRFFAAGVGDYSAQIVDALDANAPVRDKFLCALRLADRYDNSIGAPYLFVDTKRLEFEFVEE